MSEIIDQNIQTQDILIANFRGLQKDFDINDVARCVGDTHPVVVIDRMVKMTSKTLRKAAFTILQLNKIDVKSIAKLIQNQRHSSVWHHMSRIICIVPTGLSLNERLIILQNFFANGFWNFVVVYETVKGIEYESLKSSGSRYKRLTIVNPKYGHLIFPDKLKNLERFEYQVASVKNSNNSYISSLMINFLHTVTHQQNSTFKMLNLQNLTILEDYWRTRKLHLLINLVTVKYSPEPTLMIYEEKSYCALVPITEITSFFLVIITKPFDRFMWVLIGLSMVCSVTVWRLFLGRGAIDSHWKVAALWFMIFIGQGLDFSSKNRTVLLLLIHLISISIFILSNAYESIVTSFMIDPSQKHLKSIKDLLESNFEIAVGQAFKYNFRNSSEFSSIVNSPDTPKGITFGNNLIKRHYAFIRLCDVAEGVLNLQRRNRKYLSEYYYILPERIPSQFIRLEASFLNPFLERFQHYMDLSFVAGLLKIWKVFDSYDVSELKNFQQSKDYLELKDLGPVFLILFIGCILSAVVMFVEIFHQEFIRNLNWSRFYECLRRRTQLFCNKRQEIKVNKVTVQPQKSAV